MASASTLMLFARLIMSLAVVIGLMWVAANVLRKRGFTGVGRPAQDRADRRSSSSRAGRSVGTRRSRWCASASVRWSSASPTTR